MSLPESFRGFIDQQPEELPPDDAAPLDPDLLKLREALDGIFDAAGEQHAEHRKAGKIYIFRGTLLIPAEGAFDTISERFAAAGYSPMLQRERDEDVVMAIEGDIPQRRFNTPWWLHLGLLLLTIATTTIMGASLTGRTSDEFFTALREWNTILLRDALRDALPFSLTLLTILGVHEMGHYIAARRHGIKVTLPFFIPLPFSNTLGTMGAVIFIKSPLINRRALFDVGIAGPLAGLVTALPLYMIGLRTEATLFPPANTWLEAGIRRVANPPLLEALASLVVDTQNLDRYVFYGHPMALAAWFGVLLTALNLLPLGQFDGGHIAYALLGRRAWPLATFTFVMLAVLGLLGAWFAWLIWAMLGLLTGLRHPPPHDDLTPLGRVRTVIGVITAILFLLIIVPTPFPGI
jgi:Zn-dependent protease